MNEILNKLINKEKITDTDIAVELYEICDSVHSSCDDSCPVFKKNRGIVRETGEEDCACFKSGMKMLLFLRK